MMSYSIKPFEILEVLLKNYAATVILEDNETIEGLCYKFEHNTGLSLIYKHIGTNDPKEYLIKLNTVDGWAC